MAENLADAVRKLGLVLLRSYPRHPKVRSVLRLVGRGRAVERVPSAVGRNVDAGGRRVEIESNRARRHIPELQGPTNSQRQIPDDVGETKCQLDHTSTVELP